MIDHSMKGYFERAMNNQDDELQDSKALDAIAELMSGTEWDADTLDAIASVVTLTGREIKDPFDVPTDTPPQWGNALHGSIRAGEIKDGK